MCLSAMSCNPRAGQSRLDVPQVVWLRFRGGLPMKTPTEIGQAILDRLAAQAAANREAGAYALVRALLEKEPNLTGSEIVARITRRLSVRRAQELAKAVRRSLDRVQSLARHRNEQSP